MEPNKMRRRRSDTELTKKKITNSDTNSINMRRAKSDTELIEKNKNDRCDYYRSYDPIFNGVHITLDLEGDDIHFKLLKNGTYDLNVSLYDWEEKDKPGVFQMPRFGFFKSSTSKKQWTGIYGKAFGHKTELVFLLRTKDGSIKSESRLPFTRETTNGIIDFLNEFQLRVTVTMKTKIDIDMRHKYFLCSEEKEFVKNRKTYVLNKLNKKFGDEIISQMKDVPHIAIIGSGGGMRAVVGMCGVLTALEDEEILDYSMYTAGLSGSAWYLMTLYAYDDKLEPTKVSKHIRQKLKNNYGIYFKLAWTILKFSAQRLIYGHDYYYTITDVFGEIIGDLLLGEKSTKKWSEQKQKCKKGCIPLPLIAALHVHREKTTDFYQEWMELSPYEVHLPGYGVGIKMNYFGSSFNSGFCKTRLMEPPIHFLQGICGSAFAIKRDLRPQERFENFDWDQPNAYKLGKRAFFNNVDGFVVAQLPNLLHGISEIRYLPQKRTGTHIKSTASKDSFWSKCRSVIKSKILYVLDKLAQWWCQISENILFPESGLNEFAGLERDSIMMLMDAGIAFNSPYPTVLNPARNVDIILSFDFSDRYQDGNLPFEELRKAAAWAEKRNVDFPKLDPQLKIWEKEWTEGNRQEVYVFQGSPTIVHFVLINKSYRSTGMQGDATVDFDIFPRYSTFKFRYSNKDFDRLSKLVQHNIKENKEQIIRCILEHIRRKQGLIN